MTTLCKGCQPMPVCVDVSGTSLDRYSLQEDVYGFVVTCPPGQNCTDIGRDYIVRVLCCDGLEISHSAIGLTLAERNSLIQGMLEECARRLPFCDDGDGGGDGGGDPPPDVDDPRDVFMSSMKRCQVVCPDGSMFTYTLPAGRYIGFNQSVVDLAAQTEACRLARLHQLCLSALPTEICKDTAFSYYLRVSGLGTRASHHWAIVSGTLPSGLTINGNNIIGGWVPGKKVLIAGTPTTAGSSTFTVRVANEDLDFMDKTFTICVVGISPSTVPDATVGEAYSQALTVPDCAVEPLSWQVSAGALPDGLTLNEETGVISGIPTDTAGDYTFTVQLQTET